MKIILKIVLSLILVILLTETGIRISEKFSYAYFIGNESGTGFKAKVVNKFLYERINTIWSRKQEDRKTFLEPPFPVFVNKGFENKERIDFIFQRSALPKNVNVTAENFLRLNKSEKKFTYQVTTNSLGFRGRERSIEKPKNTFRIIVLGSYPAFGHGANDDETYPHLLEKALQENSHMNVEVWNGGMQGGTVIMGYARLINEVERYQPDLVIWDYGWIELYLTRDKVHHPTHSAMKAHTPVERKILQICLGTFMSSFKLCQLSARKILKVNYNDAIAGWRESMHLLKKWSQKNDVPVAFLRHRGVTIPESEYEAFHDSSSDFVYVDTSQSLRRYPTKEEIEEFWSQENWLSEVGFGKDEVMAQEPDLIFFGDGLQYNKLGYKRIGDQLNEIIQSKFPGLHEKKPKKPAKPKVLPLQAQREDRNRRVL